MLFVSFNWATVNQDFLPGRAPTEKLIPNAWTTTDDRLTFAILGDNGTGGRGALNVARQMARTYQSEPYGVVILAGDVSYYGSIQDRFEQVFARPMAPLVDAGVEFEIAIGNHELEEEQLPDAEREITLTLEAFGKPDTFYKATHGPVDFFMIDTASPEVLGIKEGDQLAWLERELAASTAKWKVAVTHYPPYASGRRGSYVGVRAVLEPLFVEHGVTFVITGHEHFYERTTPQQGVTYVISGGGAKLTPAGTSDFTAYSESVRQFMLCDVEGDAMVCRAIDEDGAVFDRFEVHPR